MTTAPSEKSYPTTAVKQASTPLAGERLISRAELRQFVTASDMALWRWLRAKKFPSPIYIGNRRYWKASELAQWLDSKEEVQHDAS